MGIDHPDDRLKIAPDALCQFLSRSALFYGRPAPTSPVPLDSGQRMSFVIEHPLNFQHCIDISLHIQSLVAATLFGLEETELRLPKPQDISRQFCNLADFANLIEDLTSQSGLIPHRPSLILPVLWPDNDAQELTYFLKT